MEEYSKAFLKTGIRAIRSATRKSLVFLTSILLVIVPGLLGMENVMAILILQSVAGMLGTAIQRMPFFGKDILNAKE